MMKNNDQDWQVFELGNEASFVEYLEIIEDGLSHLFEFKVEDHKLYFREIVE